MLRFLVLIVAMALLSSALHAEGSTTSRKPGSEVELKTWLINMVQWHKFTPEEVAAATGMNETEVTEALIKYDIHPDNGPECEDSDAIPVFPYPGGRHPRIGFLDGAIDPQRETKISVFTPWQPEDKSRSSYVVVDVPEAIWSNLGLTYLAHTHIPTIWDKQGVILPPQEWKIDNRTLSLTRTLPNGVEYQAVITPQNDHVGMTLTLKNGTSETLSDLRVQNCVMLKGASGFDQQTNDNKVIQSPYCACHDTTRQHWVITAWTPCQRAWCNPPCPCLHSDPQFPDCPPGETRQVRGWISFYHGENIHQEFRRIADLGWDQK